MSAEPNRPVWTDLHARLHQTLRQTSLLPPRSLILMAVSGGQDSLCLSQLLIDLQPKWGWQLAVGHCDHGWPEDIGLAEHVRATAASWQVPFHCLNIQDLAETEAAARDWRYVALAHMAQTRNYQFIVTAHTQTDVAETLLHNLVRGASSQGLSSLSAVRSLTANVQLVRPLLHIQRSETGDFCQQRHLPVWEDPYNHKLKYARNRVRQQLIPWLETNLNNQAVKHLAQTAEILQSESAYLDSLALAVYQQSLVDNERLDRSPLQVLPIALQRRVVRFFLQDHQISISFQAIEQVVALINAPQGSQTSSLAGGTVRVEHGHLSIKKGYS